VKGAVVGGGTKLVAASASCAPGLSGRTVDMSPDKHAFSKVFWTRNRKCSLMNASFMHSNVVMCLSTMSRIPS
jgi:hypothetical protein